MEGGVRVLERCFDIVDLLAASTRSLGVTEIAQSTGMSKSTAHRLLTAMHRRHYVEKRGDATYRIGIKMLQTASYHINTLELLTESMPFLAALRAGLGLTSHLGILEGDEVVYLGLSDSTPNSKLYAQVGRRSPAYCSSMGKCLLACLGRDELEESLNACKFERFTPKTICDRDELRRHLLTVRGQGWAMDMEEYKPGHCCVAAPVFDYRGDSLAAVSVSGTPRDFPARRLEQIAQAVRDCATDISRSMGYAG